jgi:cyclase
VRFGELVEAGSPLELALRYEAEGADELVVLDISATSENRSASLETVVTVRENLTIPLTVGGGVRGVGDVEKLLLAGADKVGVNTAAIERPELLSELAKRFGAQCTVLAIDAKKRASGAGWEVVTHSGKRSTGIDAVQWAKRGQELGAGEILLTSWDRDGTGGGYDCELLREIAHVASVPIIASGGAGTASHIVEAVSSGATAVLVASMLHFGRTTVGALKGELKQQGVKVRDVSAIN